MAQHFLQPTAPTETSHAVRLGAGSTPADQFSYLEQGKAVRLVGESRYDLAPAGAEIEGFITSIEAGTAGGFSIGGIVKTGRVNVTLDGLQATPGTGSIAVGDYVVAGTLTAKGTALAASPKVCKATAAPATLLHKWRVVSIYGNVGNVGQKAVVERV